MIANLPRHRLSALGWLGALGVGSHLIAGVLPVSALVVAVAMGVLASTVVGVPQAIDDGDVDYKLFLEVGIVLLGVRLTLSELAEAGPQLIVLAVLTIVAGTLLVEFVSRRVFGLRSKTGALLAAGTSICGVSAVLAVAGSIDATEEDIAYVAGTILLFDALTMVAFPLAGHLLSLSPSTFGVWAGLTMFSTGPVAAAGFAYDPIAGKWATITKIVRNSFIGLSAVAYSVYFARASYHTDGDVTLSEIWRRFPKFLVGFALVVAVTNLGLIGPATVEWASAASNWLFTIAFVGLGFDIRLDRIRNVGYQPIAVVVCYLLVMGTMTLTATTRLL